MAKGKRTDMQLKISGIPQDRITRSLEVELERRDDVFVEIVGNTRNLVFDDQRFIKEFLKKNCKIG